MRAPPEAVRTQIQQLLVDRMVKKQHFCLVVVCPTALVVVCSTGLGLVIVQLVSLSTGLTVNDIEGEEDVSGRTGDCDEFCGSR